MGNYIPYISFIVTAIATAMIAYYAIKSHGLSEEIKSANELRAKRDDEFREQISDLYKAIVFSNIVGGQSEFLSAVRHFNALYREASWKTKIIGEISTKPS